MIVTDRRNIPVLFCNFDGSDGQRLSYIQPFTNSRSPAEQTDLLSEWYHRTKPNDEICGSQCELADACGWYDHGFYDLTAYDDYFIIAKEHTAQDPHGSTVWVVCAEKFGCGFHCHKAQMDCHDAFEDLIAEADIDHAYICETAEVADELMRRLGSI